MRHADRLARLEWLAANYPASNQGFMLPWGLAIEPASRGGQVLLRLWSVLRTAILGVAFIERVFAARSTLLVVTTWKGLAGTTCCAGSQQRVDLTRRVCAVRQGPPTAQPNRPFQASARSRHTRVPSCPCFCQSAGLSDTFGEAFLGVRQQELVV